VSIPPFLEPPSGVDAVPVATGHGTFASLDNRAAVRGRAVGSAVLVPGFTGSKEDFIGVLRPLAERQVRAVAFDLTGQFETAGPEEAQSYSLPGFAADVWAVAATLPRPLVLVGHSFGGLVVRDAVLADPLAADGLTLIASGPAALPDDQQAVLRMFIDVMNRHGLEAVLQGKRAMDVAAGFPEPPPDIEAFLTRRFLANAAGSLQAMIEALCGVADEVDALAAVAPPTTVIIGGRDDVWPIDQQREMASRLGAAVTELPDAGHSPAVDAPDAVADAIVSLFSSAGSR
jgi:pimeloyl-ACP methyl ester carboxylesterase